MSIETVLGSARRARQLRSANLQLLEGDSTTWHITDLTTNFRDLKARNYLTSNGGALQTDINLNDTLLLRAYDVDGATYVTFGTLTAANTPSFTLANITMSGTWLASGTVTVPALSTAGILTLGAGIACDGNTITGQGMATYNTGTGLRGAAADGRIFIIAGPSNSFDSYLELHGSSYAATPGQMLLFTTGASSDNVLRLTMGAAAAIVNFTWSAVYHTGLKYGLAGTATGAFTMDGATSGVVTVKVADTAGTWTLTLPPDGGDAGEQLQTNGSGITTWEAAGSLREYKIVRGLHSSQDALDKILHTKIYDWQYEQGRYLPDGRKRITTGDYQTVYTSPMADESPWAMHHEGKIFNPLSAFGFVTLAIQAQQDRMDSLERELAELKGRL